MLAAKQRLSLVVILFFLTTSYTYAGTITVNSLADTDARGDDITLREAIIPLDVTPRPPTSIRSVR